MNSLKERDRQFFELYQQYRASDQGRYYDARYQEFSAAEDQAIRLNTIIMVMTSTAAALATANVGGMQFFGGLLAAMLPILGTALTAYAGLYEFGNKAALYHNVAVALHRTRSIMPNVASKQTSPSLLKDYVIAVETAIDEGNQQLFKPQQ